MKRAQRYKKQELSDEIELNSSKVETNRTKYQYTFIHNNLYIFQIQ
jgi:hypothetical protein